MELLKGTGITPPPPNRDLVAGFELDFGPEIQIFSWKSWDALLTDRQTEDRQPQLPPLLVQEILSPRAGLPAPPLD